MGTMEHFPQTMNTLSRNFFVIRCHLLEELFSRPQADISPFNFALIHS